MITIAEAVEVIKRGDIVALPTETVYGLGADATSQAACLKIYKAKGRPTHNPLIIHVNSLEQVEDYALPNEDMHKLSKLWPGPMTLVLPKLKDCKLADCVTAGLETVAIRIPEHKIARELIEGSGCPIAAPSANKSGRLSPTTYEHVYSNFGKLLPILRSGEKNTYGLESTIIDLSTDKPVILRLGFITPEIIEGILEKKVTIASEKSEIKAPGMLLKHYAPKTRLRLNAEQVAENEIGLGFADRQAKDDLGLNLSPEGSLAEAAANLFEYLHILDNLAQNKELIDSIAVAPIPNQSIGLAINDRLSRAAGSHDL